MPPLTQMCFYKTHNISQNNCLKKPFLSWYLIAGLLLRIAPSDRPVQPDDLKLNHWATHILLLKNGKLICNIYHITIWPWLSSNLTSKILRACLIGHFKQYFEHFKYTNTHFYTLFHPHIYQKHQNNIT